MDAFSKHMVGYGFVAFIKCGMFTILPSMLTPHLTFAAKNMDRFLAAVNYMTLYMQNGAYIKVSVG